jgi:YggT family protein
MPSELPIDLISLALGVSLGLFTLLFILRIVLSWYPESDLTKFPLNVVAVPTEGILVQTRKVIKPLGGIDMSPVFWVAVLMLVREILVGQQGLLKMLN